MEDTFNPKAVWTCCCGTVPELISPAQRQVILLHKLAGPLFGEVYMLKLEITQFSL